MSGLFEASDCLPHDFTNRLQFGLPSEKREGSYYHEDLEDVRDYLGQQNWAKQLKREAV
jgi:hypothetical protein